MIRQGLAMAMAMVLLTAHVAVAENVFVTTNGKKYHKAECRLIKSKNPQSIDRSEALKNNLEPCKKCFKDEMAQVESKDKNKAIK